VLLTETATGCPLVMMWCAAFVGNIRVTSYLLPPYPHNRSNPHIPPPLHPTPPRTPISPFPDSPCPPVPTGGVQVGYGIEVSAWLLHWGGRECIHTHRKIQVYGGKMKKISYPEWEIVMMGFAHLFLKSWV
jgi:hypothetical protein